MTVGELIGTRAFPTVVQATDVQALRNEKHPDAARDFISGYLGFDERSRHALGTCLTSLTSTERGGAFFLNGVFGSGKSHLLGLLALLSDGIGQESFAATHPQLTTAVNAFPTRLAVYFSLDDYNAAKISLEEAVHREIAREWQRRFHEELDLTATDSRREYFAALDEKLPARGCNGLVVLIDELSLFLSAKPHTALQADAAFLQFIAQRATHPGPGPTHVFAAMQKTIDDVGDLEAYSLSQIRDRFQTLPLSLAHVPSLISHRLIAHKNPPALQKVCRDHYHELCTALPRLDSSLREWETLFPFHPATITLLGNIVTRFFSRTRSAALFCAQAAQRALAAPANTRILPDALFDYFLPELEIHPELRPLAAVWQRWQNEADELAADATEAQTLRRMMKTLLVFKIAGLAPTAVQLANALALDAKLPGEGNYEYARVLLERILTQGPHLAVERAAGSDENEAPQQPADRYTVDWGTRVSELARRHLKNALKELHPHDARVAAHVLASCHDESLPLHSLTGEQTFPVFWCNAPREIAVQVLQAAPSPQALANRLAMLREPGAREELLLLIIPPFSRLGINSQPATHNPQFILWIPRLPTTNEIQAAREAAAAHLLKDDPQLLDNRRGRAVLQFLKDASTPRTTQTARLARQLLHEGVLQTGDGRVIEARELALGKSWDGTLEAIAGFALPAVFPQFESGAPRSRVMTGANTDQLCLEILRRPLDDPFFPASLERLARALAQPLGLAAADKGRWKITAPRDDLSEEIKTHIGDGITLGALEALLAKSRWGLKNEQLALVLCALLRHGELTAQNIKGEILLPAKIGLPLRRAVHTLRPGQLLDAPGWTQLQTIVTLLTSQKPGTHSFAGQARAKALLLQKRDEMQAEGELLQARLRQLQRAFNHSPAQWPRAENTLQDIATLLEKLGDDSDSNRFLRSAAFLEPATLAPLLAQWEELQTRFESRHADLLGIHRLLTHPRLGIPAPLQAPRAAMLEAWESSEAILTDDQLLTQVAGWRAEYARLYRDWHRAQHEAARWNSFRRLQNSDTLRALERLGTLRSRPFSQHHELQSILQAELAKQCPRDGALLPGEATCNACDLRFGERISLHDPNEIATASAHAIVAFQNAVHESQAQAYLARDKSNAPLLEWSGDPAELLPLLTDETLSALDNAFKPRRRVARSAADLKARFSNCRTRNEFEVAFQSWLNGEENLAGDDEIEMI